MSSLEFSAHEQFQACSSSLRLQGKSEHFRHVPEACPLARSLYQCYLPVVQGLAGDNQSGNRQRCSSNAAEVLQFGSSGDRPNKGHIYLRCFLTGATGCSAELCLGFKQQSFSVWTIPSATLAAMSARNDMLLGGVSFCLFSSEYHSSQCWRWMIPSTSDNHACLLELNDSLFLMLVYS